MSSTCFCVLLFPSYLLDSLSPLRVILFRAHFSFPFFPSFFSNRWFMTFSVAFLPNTAFHACLIGVLYSVSSFYAEQPPLPRLDNSLSTSLFNRDLNSFERAPFPGRPLFFYAPLLFFLSFFFICKDITGVSFFTRKH